MADEPKEKQPSPVPAGDKPASSPAAIPSPKPAAAAPTGVTPPRPAVPVPPKPPVQLQTPPNNELLGRIRPKFGPVLVEASEDRKPALLTVECGNLAESAQYLRDEEQFYLLSALTDVE